MRIGSGQIDTRRGGVKNNELRPKGKTMSWLDMHEEQLGEYERYQRRAFENVALKMDGPGLKQRLADLDEELTRMGYDPGSTHYRRIRAERDAVASELNKRG